MKKQHNIPPFYEPQSEILILGSFPSERSREEGFFYAHPTNRFWAVLKTVFKSDDSIETIEDKKKFLIKNKIALWDVIGECEIERSADSSIRDASVNDINSLMQKTNIKRIFTNGKAADKLYKKYVLAQTKKNAVNLPSTSAANAAYCFSRLVLAWSIIK